MLVLFSAGFNNSFSLLELLLWDENDDDWSLVTGLNSKEFP